MEQLGPPNPVETDGRALVGQEHQGVHRFKITLASAIDGTLKIILGLALLGEIGVVFVNVLSRSLIGNSLTWALEVAELALSVMAFVGGALAYRRGDHAFIRTLIEALPLRSRRASYAVIEFLVFTIAITMGLNALPLFIAQWEELTPLLQLRESWFVLPLIVSMVVLAVTAIERLFLQHRPTVLAVGAAFSTVVILLFLTHGVWRPWVTREMGLALAVVSFFVPVLLGLPVGFALLLGAIAYLYTAGSVPMIVLANSMVHGTGNFVLLALPFFIFAGFVMNDGGISVRLVRLAQSLLGHFRGGLLQVMVVSMYVVSGLSGSKAADVAAVGSVMRDMLRREGYSLEQSTAVLSASAVMGETVPPSIGILVLASVTTLSTGALFIGGLMPAAVIGVCLMILIYFQTRRMQAGRRSSLRQVATAAVEGILPLIMPVILIGGILVGLATPTEISSFAVIYGLVLTGIIYQELKFRVFVRGLISSAAVSGMILFILAAAKCFAWVLTVAQLPQRLVLFLSRMHESQVLFMLATILLLIVAGAILEGLPALLILAPIVLPIASLVGVNQLHYGIVLIIAMGFGSFLPGVGVGFYVACAVCETTVEKSGRAMIPYIIVLLFGLLLVALVPWFALYLPAKFHMAG